jgi:hypothetical protein
MSVVIASLGIFAKTSHLAIPAVALAGAAWAALYSTAVVPLSHRHLRTSAVLQEMFDTTLFKVPWNVVLAGEPLSEDELSRLSRQFRGNEARLRDYYLVASVASPYDILFCFEQNFAWGSRVRRRFAQILIAIIVLWCVVGFALGFVTDSTVSTLVSAWFVPSLGLLLLCLDISRAQISITRERTRVLALVRAVIDTPGSPHLADNAAFDVFARQVQDVLFLARRQQSRTPGWFFRLFHDNDMTDFRGGAEVRQALVEFPGPAQ